MKETIKTENAEIEILANGEAISLCITDTEFNDFCSGTQCSWLDADQCFLLASTLLDAMIECYPERVDGFMEDE